MKTKRKSAGSNMRKYYQLLLVIVCFISVVTLLIYRHEYYRLRYVLEVLNFFGKPGLSEIEFCGAGFNATLLTEIMRNSSIELRETPPLFQPVDEDFYTYSSFVRSYVHHEQLAKSHAYLVDTIAVGKEGKPPNLSCKIWIDQHQDLPIPGKFTYKTIRKSVNGLSLYVFQCSSSKYLGYAKGVSYYANDYNISPYHAPILKLVYVNDRIKFKKSSRIRFVNNIKPAICVIPNQMPVVSSDSLITFLLFHHIIGIDHFTIYDSMISNNLIKTLNLIPNDIKQWDLQFFPLNFPFTFSQSYEILRLVVELDCIFRHFRKDKEDLINVSHIMVMSWDEHLVPRVHVNLKSVLDDFDPIRKIPSIEVPPLLFCLNQIPDDNTELYYPEIFRKTHYYIMPHDSKPVFIYNLDVMSSFEDIYSIRNLTSKKIPLDQIGMQKYTVCSKSSRVYNKTEMEMFQHKFEGAIFKFSHTFINHKIFRLYKNSKIWNRSSIENVRDIL